MGRDRLGNHTPYSVDTGEARIIIGVAVTPASIMENTPMLEMARWVRFRWLLHPNQRMDKLEQICVILNSNQVCYWPSCKCTQPLFMAQVEIMMSGNKTTANDQDVELFLNAVEDEQKRKDSFMILELMKQVSGNEPKMWGSSIVGFGSYRYQGKSGREGDWMVTGFSPRKANLTIYGIGGLEERDDLLKKLGKHTTGKGCLYIKRLSDVDLPTLKKLIEEVVKQGGQNAKPE